MESTYDDYFSGRFCRLPGRSVSEEVKKVKTRILIARKSRILRIIVRRFAFELEETSTEFLQSWKRNSDMKFETFRNHRIRLGCLFRLLLCDIILNAINPFNLIQRAKLLHFKWLGMFMIRLVSDPVNVFYSFFLLFFTFGLSWIGSLISEASVCYSMVVFLDDNLASKCNLRPKTLANETQ